jgi:hypothetical protein
LSDEVGNFSGVEVHESIVVAGKQDVTDKSKVRGVMAYLWTLYMLLEPE